MDEIATGKKTANEAQEDRAGDAEREFVLDREIVAFVDGEVARFQALEDRMHVTDADSSVSAMTNPPEMSGASPRAYSPGKR